MKKILVALVLGIICWPLAASVCLGADDSVRPEQNPLCWKKEDCIQAKQDIVGDVTAQQGWIQEYPCLGEWGKCLAGQATKTSIAIGGRTEFSNVGEYIQTVYNYALIALGVLAVVVIILSGVQWITSAGNSETISQSKKRIGGAVIGLFIAYMSYNILNSINPALVNLRLPQVWMMRPIPPPVKWCQDIKSEMSAVTLKINEDYAKVYDKKFPDANPKASAPATLALTISPDKAMCGWKFDTSDGNSCFGNRCSGIVVDGKTCGTDAPCFCVEAGNDADAGVFHQCKTGLFGGNIVTTGGKFVDDTRLMAICGNDADEAVFAILVARNNIGASDREYGFENLMFGGILAVLDNDSFCQQFKLIPANQTKVLGYILTIEVDDSSLFGGYDDDWILGVQSCGNSGRPYAGANTGDSQFELLKWGEDDYTIKRQLLETIKAAGGLWTKEQLKVGVNCDLNMSNYPNLSDSDIRDGVYYYP